MTTILSWVSRELAALKQFLLPERELVVDSGGLDHVDDWRVRDAGRRFAAWSSRRAHRGCGPGPRLAGAYPAFDQNSLPAELVRSSAVRRAGHVVQRCAGGRERLVLDARAEVAEDPVEVRDGPGVQMRQRDRLALVRIDDEVDEAR